ncbi:sugar kinase [Brevibacillus humidisoli]|nr:sugar kinase [Brevibacillus humidisoli]
MDVITIGDALIAMNPSTTGPLRFVHSFEKKVGGAELNVIIGCARLGLKAGWISRLGNDEFGRFALNFVRGEGIDTSQVQFVDGCPTSVYFKEIFEDGRTNSYYYRQQSPTSSMTPQDIDADYLKQARILHISGVFPAVCESNYEVLLHTVKLAKANGLTVTFDPNIRLKLWSAEKARQKLLALMPFLDVVLTGEEEAQILVGTSEPDEVFQAFQSLGIDHIVLKQGERGAIASRHNQVMHSPAAAVSKVVDTVGAGDGFAAGYLYGLLHQWNLRDCLQLANAVGALVVGVSGDNEGLPYMDEVKVFLGQKVVVDR